MRRFLSRLTHPTPNRTNPLVQAVQFLVIGNKQKRTLEEITTDLCPVLSIQQLYRISTMYWDDRSGLNRSAEGSVCMRES